mgnify:CR=1 FL=1
MNKFLVYDRVSTYFSYLLIFLIFLNVVLVLFGEREISHKDYCLLAFVAIIEILNKEGCKKSLREVLKCIEAFKESKDDE